MQELMIDGKTLRMKDVEAVARGGVKVGLDAAAADEIRSSRRVVEQILASGEVMYGINTGFGKLAEVRIPDGELATLQLNLLRSHCVGTGEPFPEEVVRAMLLLRANVLATGRAGCRVEVVEKVLEMLNAGVLPVVPSQGSVGASGDLAPLAHLAIVLVGEGEAVYRGRKMPGGEALAAAGIEPLFLEAKEGLALINGTQASAALGCLAVGAARRIIEAADVVAALSIDALAGTDAAFDPSVHLARPHPGQIRSAERIRRLLEGSEIREDHRECGRVQDAYSLRCVPQVHGAGRDALEHATRVLEIEINSATDNPMVFPDGRVISGGNFHGAPIAAVFDYLALVLADLASISERRLARLVDSSLSAGLPAFLAEEPGLHSGFMMMQVSAAALVSEAKTLAHPASVDSIPTSASQEDHVSMSTWAARKLDLVVDIFRRVLGMEYLGAARGIEFRRPLRSSDLLERTVNLLRTEVPELKEDRFLAGDMEKAAELVKRLGVGDLQDL